ncbi:hypothetical protein [Mesorhizobium sp. L-8-10]|uniref:hypothetical protein n=1 Tax=Mesorhizobium sp. L-8-10 TaxID=2744523 RepID=UPI0019281A2F|nr:hypothetical protein [Mesorhizobium sp. L-8-10]
MIEAIWLVGFFVSWTVMGLLCDGRSYMGSKLADVWLMSFWPIFWPAVIMYRLLK